MSVCMTVNLPAHLSMGGDHDDGVHSTGSIIAPPPSFNNSARVERTRVIKLEI